MLGAGTFFNVPLLIRFAMMHQAGNSHRVMAWRRGRGNVVGPYSGAQTHGWTGQEKRRRGEEVASLRGILYYLFKYGREKKNRTEIGKIHHEPVNTISCYPL